MTGPFQWYHKYGFCAVTLYAKLCQTRLKYLMRLSIFNKITRTSQKITDDEQNMRIEIRTKGKIGVPDFLIDASR